MSLASSVRATPDRFGEGREKTEGRAIEHEEARRPEDEQGGERMASQLVLWLLVSTVTGLVTVSPTGRLNRRRPCGVQPCCRHSQLRAIAGANVRVRLRKPLGIVFEETKLGEAEGVTVADLVEDGNAWKDGRVLVGDRLAKTSAVILGGESALVTVGGGKQYTNWERELVPCTKMDFDSIMAAIGLP